MNAQQQTLWQALSQIERCARGGKRALERNESSDVAQHVAVIREVVGIMTAENETRMALLPKEITMRDLGVCIDGRWRGWLFERQGGKWVSVCKLDCDLCEVDPLFDAIREHDHGRQQR